jgi:hypothetical protein
VPEAQAQAMQQMQVQQAQIQQHVQAAQAENQLRMQQAQQMNQLQPDEIRALVNKRLYAISGEIEKYWLGVECKEASPDLRAQLGLEDGQGLVVARVAPDSPAEKAGLKQYDVILAVGETKLSRVLDLSKAVSATEGKTAELRILRGGKEQLIAVTPAQKTNDGAVQIFAHPNVGMVMPGNMQMQFHLPDNLEVKIDRKGNEPAKITVRRGNTEWETTADGLSKLPDDVRPFVQQMLGGFPGRVTIQGSSGQPLETNAITLPGMTIRAFPGTPAQPPMAAPMAPAVPGTPAAPMGNSSGVRIVTPGFAGAPVINPYLGGGQGNLMSAKAQAQAQLQAAIGTRNRGAIRAARRNLNVIDRQIARTNVRTTGAPYAGYGANAYQQPLHKRLLNGLLGGNAYNAAPAYGNPLAYNNYNNGAAIPGIAAYQNQGYAGAPAYGTPYAGGGATSMLAPLLGSFIH